LENSTDPDIEGQSAYLVSTDRDLLNVPYIHRYLSSESYWAKNIPYDRVLKSIENSFCFGVYFQDIQVGFARMITDFASFAYLADVFIDEGHRGKGLSKLLMKYIMSHPDLQGIRRISLFTRDAHALYAQFGFGACKTPENYMEIKLENPYSPQ
jgi:GNAT superfamily N-acetyltransferase